MADKKVVFLFDVDNTLLLHDQVTADLRKHLEVPWVPNTPSATGSSSSRFAMNWATPTIWARCSATGWSIRATHSCWRASFFLLSYPFANRLFPGSIDAVRHVQQFGTAVILSDGDVVFQPRKISRAGLYEVFNGNVLIYVHKEKELDDVETSLSGRALRDVRRQASHPGRDERRSGAPS